MARKLVKKAVEWMGVEKMRGRGAAV